MNTTRKPDWLKIKIDNSENFATVKKIVADNHLHTICSSGKCPNQCECWNRGTATFMIMGDVCTRTCKFCATKSGKPLPLDSSEPYKVAKSIKLMKLKHCVITSVDRDDLPDKGAAHWAETVHKIRQQNPEIIIELLIPDYQNELLKMVINSKPDIIGHNLETVERLTPTVRSKATYQNSLETLKQIALSGIITKTGIMVGLGETEQEVFQTLTDAKNVGTSMVTIGQYLQPSKNNICVSEYITPAQFEIYKNFALDLGYKNVESAPLVRSSYMSDKSFKPQTSNLKPQTSNLLPLILGIESSCDDTSASVVCGTKILSNVIAGQTIHAEYGGVVPELASRAHQQNIVPVVDTALKRAGITKEQISAIAYTNGPGLLGSLLVGSSFAKGMAMSLNVPLIEVDHLKAHILANFLDTEENTQKPEFPFLCLTVSGGHTQLLMVRNYFDMEIIGRTIDDAAGEAFDKAAKILGLTYPGGPVIDKLAQKGNPKKFSFSIAKLPDFNFSFSGLKTSFLYFVRDQLKENPHFIEENLNDLAASIQYHIVKSLTEKMEKALKTFPCTNFALSGGVAANSELRKRMMELAEKYNLRVTIPPLFLTTDNAAMIACYGYFKYLQKDFTELKVAPYSSTGC